MDAAKVFRCPCCHGSGPFQLEVAVLATVRQPPDANYEIDLPEDAYPTWVPSSEMLCIACGHFNLVSAFTNGQADHPAPTA